MIFLIQEQLLSIRHEEILINTLNKIGVDHMMVRIRPFTDDISPIVEGCILPGEGSNVFCIGSVKLAHISRSKNWYPGTFYNENHDFEIMLEKYEEEMLNSDCTVMNVDDPLPEKFHEGLFFARPTSDTKAFSGGHFIKDSWNQFSRIACSRNHEGPSALNENTKVILAKLKTIWREVRCFVIGGEVVTASQYRLNDRTIYIECKDQLILDYAQKMVDIYQPSDAFVLDVCETPDGFKIVEINCINCAGFYDCDINRLVNTIVKNYEIDDKR